MGHDSILSPPRAPGGPAGAPIGWAHERILVQRRHEAGRGRPAVRLVEAAGALPVPH
ncbi:hypothetical protein ACFFX0_06060 [Citricoccus parietis]|uniref:Uncharacterized protein n=1 Tax=Citricoccus parietis TaxID=592307 RepID=A0ABV5FVS5_9MICC